MAEEKKKMVKVYRDPNVSDVSGVCTQYRNGVIRYKFHPNKTEFEVEETHVMFVVRDCVDLFKTKRVAKTAKTAKTTSKEE